MKQALVVTLVGADRPGIVGRLADVVAAHDADWLESHMAELAGQFAGIVRVDVAPQRHDALLAALRALAADGLAVAIAEGRSERSADETTDDAPPARHLALELTGLDHPGIVRDIGAALAAEGVSVESFETERISGSMSGEMLFRARASLRLPPTLSLDALDAALQAVSDGLMVDIELDPLD